MEPDRPDLHIHLQLPGARHNPHHPQVVQLNISLMLLHLRKTMTVLLEATPSNIDFDLVKNTFLSVKVLTRASYLIPILTNLNLKNSLRA